MALVLAMRWDLRRPCASPEWRRANGDAAPADCPEAGLDSVLTVKRLWLAGSLLGVLGLMGSRSEVMDALACRTGAGAALATDGLWVRAGPSRDTGYSVRGLSRPVILCV